MIHTESLDKEQRIMKKLQDLVDKQRDEIRAKDHELTSRNEDVEAVRIKARHDTHLRECCACQGDPSPL